jgi:hypothetical protein
MKNKSNKKLKKAIEEKGVKKEKKGKELLHILSGETK